MSIFGTIMSKIFTHAEAAPVAPSAPASPAAPSATGAPTPPSSTTAGGSAPAGASTTAPSPSQDTSSPAAAAAPVDVGAVLDGLAAKSSQKLDWKHSIVDMMKLLDLDSSLTARKSLAEELHYTGDTSDSATMNLWLHKQVMQKLADNGGKVPADLKA